MKLSNLSAMGMRLNGFKQSTPQINTVQSFVIRDGRMTKAQYRAIEQGWPRYGIQCHHADKLDIKKLFVKQAPCVLDIGFGRGESIIHSALTYPNVNYIGIDIHRPGIGTLFSNIQRLNLHNVKVIYGDAVWVLAHQIPDHSLKAIHLFFPDPWHKNRHRKRRLIQPPFVNLMQQKLEVNGTLHLATDWEDYAKQMMKVVQQCQQLSNVAGEGQFSPDMKWHRPLTKFELRGHQLQHTIKDLYFRKHA